jgi:DUF4097 and DUF4098 domain-containing protein YvlB
VVIGHAGSEVEVEGPAIVTDGPDGTQISERLPAVELKPICRLRVPHGATVDAQCESGGLTVYRFKGTLRARLVGGSGRIDESDGHFRVVAGAGSVDLENVRGGCDILTSRGNISARHVNGDVQIVSDAGNFELEAIDGPVAARSTTGTIQASELNGPTRLSTRTGGVHVTDARQQLTARSQTGDLSLEASVVAHTTLETFRGRVEVRLGLVTDARIEATARQGVVRTERIALAPGSGRRAIRGAVGEGRARLKISTGMGVIEICGPVKPMKTTSVI